MNATTPSDLLYLTASIKQEMISRGIHFEELDEIVTDLMVNSASNINNSGAEKQISFIIEKIGYDNAIDLIIKGRAGKIP